jgi:hypothetical protein
MFRFDCSRSGLNPPLQVEFLDGGTSRSQRRTRAGVLVPLASGRNAEGALPIRTDAEVYGALLRAGAKTSYSFCKGDAGYLVACRKETISIRAVSNMACPSDPSPSH